MLFLDKILGKKKVKKETLVGKRPDPIDNPPTERPILSEPLPPKRIISEDVKPKKRKKRKKRKKKTTIITKKRSENKMLPEIKYEYVQCDCEDWKTHLPQLVEQQQYAVNRGRKENIDLAYQIKPFVFCPWCGYKRYRSNRGKKASKQ